MSIYARIAGTEDPKILFHAFQADLTEWEAGFRTRTEIVAAHNITPAEETELDQLKGLYTSSTSRPGFRVAFDNAGLLAESGLAYLTKPAFNQRLLTASDDWLAVQKYTVAQLPPATGDSEGHTIYVSNGAAGQPVIAFSDGASWLRTDNLQPVFGS